MRVHRLKPETSDAWLVFSTSFKVELLDFHYTFVNLYFKVDMQHGL